jgi:hypothetical protein
MSKQDDGVSFFLYLGQNGEKLSTLYGTSRDVDFTTTQTKNRKYKTK